MAVAGDRHAGCDGCGRTVPIKELTTVTMPDGERVACCPQCEPHARTAAQKSASLEQRRRGCDGCTETVLASQLEDIVLDDGTVLSCCPSCVSQAPGDASRDCSNSSPSTHSSTQTATGSRSESNTRSTATGSSSPATDDTATDDSTAETNTPDSKTALCTQCQELVTAERFRVTTIDGRDERFCPDCKERAERDGIIKDVDMRNAEAREILSVGQGASDEEIQTAYHQEIKRAHPDQQSGSQSAFQLVTNAYERLQEDD